eukprot:m.127267 g.127267  ORF g.127267 m.127267 type:complete len:220 (-) comp29260_c0_seq4:127-786(-)
MRKAKFFQRWAGFWKVTEFEDSRPMYLSPYLTTIPAKKMQIHGNGLMRMHFVDRDGVTDDTSDWDNRETFMTKACFYRDQNGKLYYNNIGGQFIRDESDGVLELRDGLGLHITLTKRNDDELTSTQSPSHLAMPNFTTVLSNKDQVDNDWIVEQPPPSYDTVAASAITQQPNVQQPMQQQDRTEGSLGEKLLQLSSMKAKGLLNEEQFEQAKQSLFKTS